MNIYGINQRSLWWSIRVKIILSLQQWSDVGKIYIFRAFLKSSTSAIKGLTLEVSHACSHKLWL